MQNRRPGLVALSCWDKSDGGACGTAVAVGDSYTPTQAKALTGAFSGAVGDITKRVLNNSYDRKVEQKADTSALKYMNEAGYDPTALVALLKTQESRGIGKGDYLSMSAGPKKRIAWLEKDIKKNNMRGTVIAQRTNRFNREIAKLREHKLLGTDPLRDLSPYSF